MNNNYCRYDISDGCVVGDLGVWSTLGAQRNHSEAGRHLALCQQLGSPTRETITDNWNESPADGATVRRMVMNRTRLF